jgi:hypothetical protein
MNFFVRKRSPQTISCRARGENDCSLIMISFASFSWNRLYVFVEKTLYLTHAPHFEKSCTSHVPHLRSLAPHLRPEQLVTLTETHTLNTIILLTSSLGVEQSHIRDTQGQFRKFICSVSSNVLRISDWKHVSSLRHLVLRISPLMSILANSTHVFHT